MQRRKLSWTLSEVFILVVLVAAYWAINAIWDGGTPFGFGTPILILVGFGVLTGGYWFLHRNQP